MFSIHDSLIYKSIKNCENTKNNINNQLLTIYCLQLCSGDQGVPGGQAPFHYGE
jgi:hypothetical protein